MAKIPEYYSVSDERNLSPDRLLEIMQDMYKDLAVAVNKKPDVYVRDSNGLTSDTRLALGDININSDTGAVQTLIAHPTQDSVTWSGSGGGTGTILAHCYLSILSTTVTIYPNSYNVASAVASTPEHTITIYFSTPLKSAHYTPVDSSGPYSYNWYTKPTGNTTSYVTLYTTAGLLPLATVYIGLAILG